MKTLTLFLLRLYQALPISSHSACRYSPTCSKYAYQSITKYGILKGTLLSLKRIISCHPGSPGGYDPVT